MDNVKLMIDPTEYKAFLERYIKELHEIDAPMIAGAVERCLQKLEEYPTVDAVEVVRGRWIKVADLCGLEVLKCSVCGREHPRFHTAYCCDCGAKMDGGNENGSAQV